MYIPKLHHAIFTTLVSVFFAWLYTEYKSDALAYGAVAFMVITFVIMFMVVEGAHYNHITAYIEALVKMDPELRNALAFQIPALNLIVKRGAPIIVLPNTMITREELQLFLQDSTKTHTASRNKWFTKERPRRKYDEIRDWLWRNKMIGEYASGPESYAWIGHARLNLMNYYLNMTPQDLSRADSSQAYAEDDEQAETA